MQQHRQRFLPAILRNFLFTRASPVYDDAAGNTREAGSFHGQFQIVQAEGRGLGYEQAEITALERLHHGAGGAGRRIDDGNPIFKSVLLDPADDRRGHGFTDVQPALDELQLSGRTPVDSAALTPPLGDGLFRTKPGAGAAAVAKFRENEGMFGKGSDGMVNADLGTQPAVSTFSHVYFRNRYGDRLAALNNGPEKDSGVGFFHITIKESDLFAFLQGESETGGNERFTRTAFPAGNGKNHSINP